MFVFVCVCDTKRTSSFERASNDVVNKPMDLLPGKLLLLPARPVNAHTAGFLCLNEPICRNAGPAPATAATATGIANANVATRTIVGCGVFVRSVTN